MKQLLCWAFSEQCLDCDSFLFCVLGQAAIMSLWHGFAQCRTDIFLISPSACACFKASQAFHFQSTKRSGVLIWFGKSQKRPTHSTGVRFLKLPIVFPIPYPTAAPIKAKSFWKLLPQSLKLLLFV